jgi:hypothetical protein
MEINAVAIALILIVGGGCALLVSIGRSQTRERARSFSRPLRRREDAEVP